ncbi:hypothetical protein PLESTB_000336900 [Pleodorina starrii]|uniref:Uncharacterized protein n=1 Tax=Pleodorina starrii TaxID=330485 RepID=A0A9W6BE14_9CHLO|nr:hypothetical protein PLESTB_000336900 [Pleodorina starrii]
MKQAATAHGQAPPPPGQAAAGSGQVAAVPGQVAAVLVQATAAPGQAGPVEAQEQPAVEPGSRLVPLQHLSLLLKSAKTPGGHYYSNLYLNSPDGEARRMCYTQLLTATGAEHGVLKFDHCHKPAKKIRLSDLQSKPCMGTAWALNGNSEIMGFYHPIQVVYVDNAAQTHQVWRKLLVTDRPGGVMVKQDMYHLKRRFMEAVPSSHKLYNSFSSDLSALLLPIYPPDVERLKGIDAVSLRRKARKFVPPGSGRDVLLAVQSLLNRYKVLDGGNHFITPAVEKVLNDQWSLVKDGNDMISDPYPINLMYYIDPATKQYRSIRTTSQVENLNRRFNALLQGCVLPGLADALILDFAGRNNIDQALRAGRGLGLPESMYNLYLASRLNKCVPAGLSLPFPAWAKIQQLAAAGVVERFGFKWQEQLAVEAILEASAESTMPEISVAQLVEHSLVNSVVMGSIPCLVELVMNG